MQLEPGWLKALRVLKAVGGGILYLLPLTQSAFHC